MTPRKKTAVDSTVPVGKVKPVTKKEGRLIASELARNPTTDCETRAKALVMLARWSKWDRKSRSAASDDDYTPAEYGRRLGEHRKGLSELTRAVLAAEAEAREKRKRELEGMKG